MGPGKERLLFFDLLRIISVALIVFYHIACVYYWAPFYGDTHLFNVVYIYPGAIGVAIMIFVCGAVLEYTHPGLAGLTDIGEFYWRRLTRIYPAFWMSMIIGLALLPEVLVVLPLWRVALEFTGFSAVMYWGGDINPVGWFIGLLVALYLAYPFLSAAIRKYPYLALGLIAFVEIIGRYFLHVTYFPGLGLWPDKWMPFCNFLEFSLGIWIVQQGVFPKQTYENGSIRFLAEISFYVFLVHWAGRLGNNLLPVSLPLYLIVVGFLAWLLMIADREIQARLKRGWPVRD